MDNGSGNSVYKIDLAFPNKKTFYVKLGYGCDLKPEVECFDFFGDIKAYYLDNNILEMTPAKGYRLTDIISDQTPEPLNYQEFKDVGYAVGEYVSNFHKMQSFEFTKDHIFYNKFDNLYDHGYGDIVESFKRNPGKLTLVHGDLSPNNIFIDLQTMKVCFVDMDRFVKFRKIGGMPAYEYHQFLSGVDWCCKKYVLNKLYLKTGFMCGYKTNSLTGTFDREAHDVAKLYWDHK